MKNNNQNWVDALASKDKIAVLFPDGAPELKNLSFAKLVLHPKLLIFNLEFDELPLTATVKWREKGYYSAAIILRMSGPTILKASPNEFLLGLKNITIAVDSVKQVVRILVHHNETIFATHYKNLEIDFVPDPFM